VFTGIVKFLATVKKYGSEKGGITRLEVDLNSQAIQNLDIGGSVAVNGVCLTLVELVGQTAAFELTGETRAVTNLGQLKAGDSVNIERSLSFSDEVGGHLLSGHISDTAKILDIEADEDNRRLWLGCAHKWFKYLFHKGYVALDGASLTVSEVDYGASRFAVDLIPETQRRTTLGQCRNGGLLNLEIDSQTYAIVSTVERLLGEPEFRNTLLSRA